MTDFVIPPDELTIEIKEEGSLGLYEFDNKAAHHFFCKKCGIYPFHQTFRMPDQYRVNLGCIESIDTATLDIGLFDGKSL
ncbi:MAG: GFA family protein [Cocleimonas sp.]